MIKACEGPAHYWAVEGGSGTPVPLSLFRARCPLLKESFYHRVGKRKRARRGEPVCDLRSFGYGT